MFKKLAIWRWLNIYWVILRFLLNPRVLKGRRGWVFVSHLNLVKGFHWKNKSRGQLMREALESLGPIYIKFGQLLSIREDFISHDITVELSKLQDHVPEFPGELAKKHIEKVLGQPIEESFASFSLTPLASASVAQVHPATLHTGEDVIVKVLRPNIKKTIDRDVSLLYGIASLLTCLWPASRRFRLNDLVAEFEFTILDELDLMREAANAQQLRRNFEGNHQLKVPKIYWSLTRATMMVQERVYGIRISDIQALLDAGTNMKCLAENGVEIFFTQVFRDSFFHADMHPGNLFVDITDPQKPQYIGVDFGIMGTLDAQDQYYLAENLLAFFKRDYRRVAVLHIESGWVSSDTRVSHFEGAIRAVCEPIFEKPLQDISFGRLLLRLFQVAKRFDMHVQPQLMLLQKTLFNIEALGRSLYPSLDLWATAQPLLEDFVKKQRGVSVLAKKVASDMPEVIEQCMTLPGLAQAFLRDKKNNSKVLAEHVNERTAKSPVNGLLISGALLMTPWLYQHASLFSASSWMAILGAFGAVAAVFGRIGR